MVLWNYWRQAVCLSLSFIIETMVGLWRYSLPIEERGFIRRSQKRIDSSGLAFKYIWWCKGYIWPYHRLSLYIYSLYCLYLKFHCVRTAAIDNAIPAVLVELEKKISVSSSQWRKVQGKSWWVWFDKAHACHFSLKNNQSASFYKQFSTDH